MPTLARRVRSSFYHNPTTQAQAPVEDRNETSFELDSEPTLVAMAGLGDPSKVVDQLNNDIAGTKGRKRPDKLKDRVSLAIRKFGSSQNGIPGRPTKTVHKVHGPGLRRTSATSHESSLRNYHTHRPRSTVIEKPPPFLRSNSMGSRVILQVTDKLSAVRATRGTGTTTGKDAKEALHYQPLVSGSSPPLPPLPPQEPQGGSTALKLVNGHVRESMLLSSSAFGPAFEVPALEGLGLDFDNRLESKELAVPGRRGSRSPRGSISRSVSADARLSRHLSDVPPPLPTPDQEKKAMDFKRPITPPKTSSQTTAANYRSRRPSSNSRPSSILTLEIKSVGSSQRSTEYEDAIDSASMDTHVRQRVADLRRRTGLGGTATKDIVQSTPPLAFKKTRSYSTSGPSSVQNDSLKLDARLDSTTGGSTYKPLPSLDIYVLRPTVHMATQTPDWENQDGLASRRPSDTPSTGWRISLAPSKWDNTPPQMYTTFPMETIGGSPPLPPRPQGMGSPSIYSLESTPMNQRQTPNYVQGGDIGSNAWSAWPCDADLNGEDLVPKEEEDEDGETCGATSSSSATSHDAPRTPDSIDPAFQAARSAGAAQIEGPRRGSMPEAHLAREVHEVKPRPVTIFSPSYASLGSVAAQTLEATPASKPAMSGPPMLALPSLPLQRLNKPTPILEQEEDSLGQGVQVASSSRPVTSNELDSSTPRASSVSEFSRPASSQGQNPSVSDDGQQPVRRARPTSALFLSKPAIPPRSAARGSPSRTRPVSMLVGDLSYLHAAGATSLPARQSYGSGSTLMSGHGTRRHSRGSIGSGSGSGSGSSSSRRQSKDMDNVPAVPTIPPALLTQQPPLSSVSTPTPAPSSSVPTVGSGSDDGHGVGDQSSALAVTNDGGTTGDTDTDTDVDLVLAALQTSRRRRRASMPNVLPPRAGTPPTSTPPQDGSGSGSGSGSGRSQRSSMYVVVDREERARKGRSCFLVAALERRIALREKEAEEKGLADQDQSEWRKSALGLGCGDFEGKEDDDDSDDIDEELSEFSDEEEEVDA